MHTQSQVKATRPEESWEHRGGHFCSFQAQKAADAMTPAQERSVLGKVQETFPLPPVYNFLFSCVFLWRIRTETLRRKGPWEQRVGVRRWCPLRSSEGGQAQGRAGHGHGHVEGAEDALWVSLSGSSENQLKLRSATKLDLLGH